MKNIGALLVAVVLAAASRDAAAQNASTDPAASGAGDLPPSMAPADNPAVKQPSSVSPKASDAAEDDDDHAEEILPQPEVDVDGAPLQSFLGGPMAALNHPSFFESSGTWLQRGLWYVESDFLMMNRSWNPKGLQIAFEGTTSTAPGFVNNGIGTPGFGQILAINELRIDGAKPGGDGLARVKLGRFLFRDSRNRDHAAEVSFYGGGHWEQSASLEAITPDPTIAGQGIHVNDFIDRLAPSFDDADTISFHYQTDMNSVEANYVVKSRMDRDQMQLRPDGEWVRVAQPSRTYSYLAGVRYMKLHDKLDLQATGVPVDAAVTPTLEEDGFYHIDTDNDLVGGQLGGSLTHETARWSLGASAKGGAFFNRMDLDSDFQVGETIITNSGATHSTEDNISFIGEFQILGKWHLKPNLSLRAGFEILYVDSVALAPHQLNFVPGGFTPIADAGNIFCMGSSLGLEYYH